MVACEPKRATAPSGWDKNGRSPGDSWMAVALRKGLATLFVCSTLRRFVFRVVKILCEESGVV